MFSLTLASHSEQVWLGENPSPDTFPEGQLPLLHQWRTYNAEAPLIINTYNTGTGKTKAAFLRLLKRARETGFNRLSSSEDNVLLIAPTNELLAQHARDAETFCAENKVPYQVVPISKADLDDYKGETHFSEVELRRGAALHYLIQNARQLGGDSKKKATLFVVNPDIFYYAVFFCYGKNDRIPLFQDMLTQFNFIIIDEFHYYNSKQFANFLFFMALSKHYGFSQRQFCLLTATPDEKVSEYLTRLGLDIQWITPETEQRDTENVKEVSALAPVILEVYSEQELQNGLVTLVEAQQEEIARLLHKGDDGAIISSALWRINQIYYSLKPKVSAELMGRLTGAESRQGRTVAKGKRLILATPTVDIGYNFDRKDKPRQNIDFLLLDARTSDEFIQRLGRAGRVLGKKQSDTPSRVLALVNQKLYEALQPYAGQTISRTTLREITIESLPSRHSLYHYIQSGAIAEAFLPIYRLEGMVSSAEKPDLEELFNTVRELFAPSATVSYKAMRGKIQHYITQNDYYGRMQTFPADIDECLAQCEKRLVDEQMYRKKQNKLWANKQEAFQWLQKDLREYFTEKARFSFREAFQPPLALVNDPKGLLSSEDVALYDALHIARNYHAHYHKTLKDWQQHAPSSAPPEAKDALVFCDLRDLRQPDERIQIGLKLYAHDYRKSEWEAQFVYRSSEYCPTALYGLEVIALNSGRALDKMVKNMFRERYIPVFIAADPSRTLGELRRLQRGGQIFPYELQVTFADLRSAKYYAVLGTEALLVWAEIQRKYRIIDERKGQMEDYDPIFC